MYDLIKITDRVQSQKLENLKRLKGIKGVRWVHVQAKKEDDLEEVRKHFGFHKLAIEDCIDRQQRPKVDIYDDYVLIVMKELELRKGLTTNQLGIFVGKDYVVSVSNKSLEQVEKVVTNLGKWNIKRITPDFIAYRILDRVVDSYFPILDGIEDEIEAVERQIIRSPTSKNISGRLFNVKRKLLSFRKSAWPAREVFSMLSKGQLSNFSKKNQIYYRDVYDHVVLVIDLIETYRDLTSGIMETYLSTISNNMNEVMKVLTVIATIFIPLTFVTGLYGMNFKYMPEINWEYGYAFSLILMLIMGLGMLGYFKRKDWI